MAPGPLLRRENVGNILARLPGWGIHHWGTALNTCPATVTAMLQVSEDNQLSGNSIAYLFPNLTVILSCSLVFICEL